MLNKVKICPLCSSEKGISSFSKNKNTKDGLQSSCKNCSKNFKEQYRLKNKSKDLSNIKELLCKSCNVVKDICCFNQKLDNPRGFDYWCKDCVVKNRRERYVENADEINKNSAISRAERIAWLRSLKANIPCLDCKRIYVPQCMDYDHIGKKTMSITRMTLNNIPKEKILEEIQNRCELVCVLCHNIRTKKRYDEKNPNPNRSYGKVALRNIEIINKAKSVACYICGAQRELCNMQFDHIDPLTKTEDVCQLKRAKVDILLNEIAKCRIICALCHRIKSLEEQKEKKYTSDRPEFRVKKPKMFFDPINKLKECFTCRKIKDVKFFKSSNKTTCGLDSWCEDCTLQYRAERNKQRREERRAAKTK